MRIGEVRKTKKISQKDLAKQLGISNSLLSRYENGQAEPSLSTVKRIAKILNVDYRMLIDDTYAEQHTNSYYFERMEYYANAFYSSFYRKDPSVRVYELMAITHAEGKCELCGNEAPFIDKSGTPYLEVHFVDWLSEGGEPIPTNMVALCPNCHRRIQVLRDPEDKQILKEVAAKHEW